MHIHPLSRCRVSSLEIQPDWGFPKTHRSRPLAQVRFFRALEDCKSTYLTQFSKHKQGFSLIAHLVGMLTIFFICCQYKKVKKQQLSFRLCFQINIFSIYRAVSVNKMEAIDKRLPVADDWWHMCLSRSDWRPDSPGRLMWFLHRSGVIYTGQLVRPSLALHPLNRMKTGWMDTEKIVL